MQEGFVCSYEQAMWVVHLTSVMVGRLDDNINAIVMRVIEDRPKLEFYVKEKNEDVVDRIDDISIFFASALYQQAQLDKVKAQYEHIEYEVSTVGTIDYPTLPDRIIIAKPEMNIFEQPSKSHLE